MPNLIVRNLDERVVSALKRRAARNKRSAEAEHRSILETALLKTRRRSLADVLASMPAVGRDEDFKRREPEESARVPG
jgi:plasmid stability protein